MTNRIADDCTTPKQETAGSKGTVRARRSWHWTCPDCQRTQIATKSSTHKAECWGCGATFTVDLKA